MPVEQTVDDYDHTPASNSLFLTLKDGQSAKVRIASAPFIYRDGFKQPDGTVKYSDRYAWYVYNHTAKMAQVLKQSATFFSNLKVLAKDPEWGNPQSYDITITRSGTGTESKYPIQGSPKSVEIPENGKLQLGDFTIEDFKESQIMTLADFHANDDRWPDPAAAPSGDTIVKDENPLE